MYWPIRAETLSDRFRFCFIISISSALGGLQSESSILNINPGTLRFEYPLERPARNLLRAPLFSVLEDFRLVKATSLQKQICSKTFQHYRLITQKVQIYVRMSEKRPEREV